MTEHSNQQTKEDQLVAALSHGTLLIPTFGVLVPLLVWITQKDRSIYLKNQALQATIWQLIAFLIQVLIMGCYFVAFFAFIPVGILSEEAGFFYSDPMSGGIFEGLFVLFFFLVFLVYIIGWLVYIAFGIAGVVKALRGHDFRYPVVGRWVEKRLASDEANQPGNPAESIAS